MIRSFRHKGLKRLHQSDDARGVIVELALPPTLDVAGFRLHALHGELEGLWAVTVRTEKDTNPCQ